MKTCTKCGVKKLFMEFHKNGEGLRPDCKGCVSAKDRAYREVNHTKVLARQKAYREANKESLVKKAAVWARANPEKARAAKKVWAKNNTEKDRAAKKAYQEFNKDKVAAANKAWRQANPDKRNAIAARHRSSKLQATPAWANSFFIGEAYSLAALRTKTLGFQWHVDHIVPLRSKLVCGLHVEHNLRVIPAHENRSKSNRFWPDMPSKHVELDTQLVVHQQNFNILNLN